jgi:hypothetical protein
MPVIGSIMMYVICSKCEESEQHDHIMHLIINFCWKLNISVEFQIKPDNNRVAILKSNIKKNVIFINALYKTIFAINCCDYLFSQFIFLCSHSQLNCRYFSSSLYPLVIGARKLYNLKTVKSIPLQTWRGPEGPGV